MALATRKADWLATRQAVLAQNVANANTPAYRARDLAAFDDALASAGLRLASTNARHIAASEDAAAPFAVLTQDSDATLNGNSVSLEKEMAKLGETNSQHALSISLIKSTHKLAMMALKG